MSQPIFVFDKFRVAPVQRSLTRSGVAVPLGSRAFDILLVLLSRAGEIITKEDLIATAWPNLLVDEANLRVHISALRKALGERESERRYIENIPSRGYSFVAPVERLAETPERPKSNTGLTARVPKVVTRVIGRDEVIARVAARMEETKLLTVVGPGGIGKTTVALEVASLTAARYRDGVVFVDLTTVNDGSLVTDAVIAALDAGLSSERAKTIEALLRDRVLLIILDNCEHVVDAAAKLTQEILQAGGPTRILATSREPLRADGEWVQRLPTLAFPLSDAELTAAQALDYPAIRLFADRAAQRLGGYTLTDESASLVTRICARLDGIPLAIELATGQLDVINIRRLLSSLDEGFDVLTGGRRVALSRHQKMWATLDWSYRLLSREESTIFKALAVFAGGFTAAAARAVVGDAVASDAFSNGLASLVAKSLIVADTAREPVRYRLFETTQAYAEERLRQGADGDVFARRHAEHLLALLEQADDAWGVQPAAEWIALCAAEVPNLRAALDWACAPQGDSKLAIALTIAAVPLWTQLSMVREWKSRVQRALDGIKGQSTADLRNSMQLHAALGGQQMHAEAGIASGAGTEWEPTLAIAETLNDSEYQLRALWGIWVAWSNKGRPRDALRFVDKFDALALSIKDADRCVGDRIRGKSLHLCGDQDSALLHTKRMLDNYAQPADRSDVVRFQYDQHILARATYARILWIRGDFDQARAEVSALYDAAVAMEHVTTLCNAIVDAAFPLAFIAGDLVLAQTYCARLRKITDAHGLDIWGTYAQCFAGQLLVQQGHTAEGVAELGAGIKKLERAGFILYRNSFISSLAEGLVHLQCHDEALEMVDRGIAHCRATGEAWCLAELRRVRGVILAARGGADAAAESEAEFNASLSIAREQGALAWELRTATSLAAQLRKQERATEADQLMASVGSKKREPRRASKLVRKDDQSLRAVGREAL